MSDSQIIDIVLTGGPCAGKSTALTTLVARLAEHGIRTLTVPEAATLIMTGGVNDFFELSVNDRPRYLGIQAELLGIQTDLRQRFRHMAEVLQGTVVIIYDRGQMDAVAYTSTDEFAALMADQGADLEQWRDSYTAVFHLVTAADGAPSYYTTANNQARYEATIKDAIDADQRTLAAWADHSHLEIFDNRCDFPTKLDRIVKAVLKIVTDEDSTSR